jgi:hypothetical protein
MSGKAPVANADRQRCGAQQAKGGAHSDQTSCGDRPRELNSAPLAAAYREKRAHAAIAELKTNGNHRYNTYLRTELASLYQQKQKTLQEWLQNANRN